MISAIKMPGFNRNSQNLSPFLAAACSRTDVQWWRNICIVRLLRGKNVLFFFNSFLPGRALRQENSRPMTEEGRSAENIEASQALILLIIVGCR